jgi:hypothetical protein
MSGCFGGCRGISILDLKSYFSRIAYATNFLWLLCCDFFLLGGSFFWPIFSAARRLSPQPQKQKGINVGTLEETNKKSEKVLSLIPFMKGEWQGWSIW